MFQFTDNEHRKLPIKPNAPWGRQWRSLACNPIPQNERALSGYVRHAALLVHRFTFIWGRISPWALKAMPRFFSILQWLHIFLWLLIYSSPWCLLLSHSTCHHFCYRVLSREFRLKSSCTSHPLIVSSFRDAWASSLSITIVLLPFAWLDEWN